jgi:hypothetical protein
MINSHQSRNLAARPRVGLFSVLILLAGWPAMSVTQAADLAATNTSAAIPWNEIGAKAGADYIGDGLAVTPAESGARLHCVFQRLDGEATPEGLWLTSTVTNTMSDRFCVTAMAVGRQVGRVTPCAPGAADRTFNIQHSTSNLQLEDAGIISVAGQTVRFTRPGLVEEYSVSMDGVRQDFIVEQAPLSPLGGELVVKLAVDGAQVETAADGARLVLANSGRKIAYSRLRVTDATGKELPARMEVCPAGDDATSLNSWIVGDKDIEEKSFLTPAANDVKLVVVVVNDADAIYPICIDPTFSDANWVSMGGVPGTDGTVSAAVTDGSGNLYIGGYFTVVGNTIANYIAEWNGSSWSALGSGMSGGEYETSVSALAVSGSTLYAGGSFTTAGGIAATNIAQWNGSSWSALGSGMDSSVLALVVSGGTLFAGGYFTTAGGSAANDIAQWNGSSWSPLGSGMNSSVLALAVSGSTLYAGGYFTTAGTNVSAYAAMANLPVSIAIVTTNAAFGFTGGVFGFDVTGPSGASVVIQASTDLHTWIPLQTNLLGSGLLYFSDPQSTTNARRFYRAQLSQ